jgi:hypothetical protein
MQRCEDERDHGGRIVIEGDEALRDRLGAALRSTLGERRRFYRVAMQSVGRNGEFLVTVSSAKGRLPLLFGTEDVEPGHVATVVMQNVERVAL